MQLITGGKQIRAAIAELSVDAKKINARVHVLAVSALAHVRDHGDYTIAADLLNALPKGLRRKALAHWFAHFSTGKLRGREKDNVFAFSLAKDRDAGDFRVEAAKDTPFDTLTKEREPARVFTTDTLIKMLAKRAERGEVDEETGETVASRAAIVLAATLARMARDVMEDKEFRALQTEEDALKREIQARKEAATAKPAEKSDVEMLAEALASRAA